MNEFSKENLGKLYIKNNIIYVVVGFDYLNKEFIMVNIDSSFLKLHISLPESEISNLINPSDFELEIEKRLNILNKDNEFFEIYNKHLKAAKDKVEFKNVFNRLSETYRLIKDLKFNIKYTRDKNMVNIYEREILKAEKGMRRALKRLYHYFGKNDYDKILSYLKKNDFENLESIISNINYKKSKLEKLITDYNDKKTYLDDFRKNINKGVF